ncbi:MAG: hypothetical protein AAF466_14530 [Bacteroidota bacterium]
MRTFIFLLALFTVISCKNNSEEITDTYEFDAWDQNYQAISLQGDTLRAAEPSAALLEKFEAKKTAYNKNKESLDNLIWLGRFTAYQGKYREAIDIYTQGLEQFPNNSRLLRHRGHRYISVREFDKAVADLQKAAELIQGKENMVEEDGMPNAQNIPVSTMHGNIYYHLGLAQYLNRDLPAALEAYKQCLSTSKNPDNVVSATHWIYMIQRRMGRTEAAQNYLRNIKPSMNVIENDSYYKACLFYKGELDLEDVYDPTSKESASNSALKYAIGNWYWYNGQPDQAKGIYNEILAGDDWASFGYIAAETDLARPYIQR